MKRSALFMFCAGLSALCGFLGGILAVVAGRRAGLPYNDAGHYFDGLVNYHQQSVLGYALAALVALLLAFALAWVARRVRPR